MNDTQFREFLNYRSHSLDCASCELARTTGNPPTQTSCKLSLIQYYIAADQLQFVIDHYPPNLIWRVIND